MQEFERAIASYCKQLRLSSGLAERAMLITGESHQDFLCNLLKSEVEYRQAARIEKLMNTAGFPKRYSPDQYRTDEIDFPDNVSFQSLLELDFLKQGKNVIMYGGTGTGKTMLSILIGMEACRQGVTVKFFRTAALINLFSDHHSKGTLGQLKKKLNHAGILILDEFGYVPYDRTGSQLLFDHLSEIEGSQSIILNTNLEFSQWVNVLYDQRMTTALIGRLTHHVDLILFPGGNNRLRESSINEAFSRMSVDRKEH